MPADQHAHLAAATRRRATESRARARAAIRRLNSEGAAVNYTTVARAARVSRALLYRDPELRDEINRLRDPARTTAPRPPAAERMTPGSRDELLATLRSELRSLRDENHALRARLALVLGEERATAQHLHP